MKAKTAKTFKPEDVENIAKLANIPVTDEEKETLAKGFNTTIEVVNQLNDVNTENVEPAHQVTGLENVFRDDVVDEKKMLTQEQALANTKKTTKGFFVVNQILED